MLALSSTRHLCVNHYNAHRQIGKRKTCVVHSKSNHMRAMRVFLARPGLSSANTNNPHIGIFKIQSCSLVMNIAHAGPSGLC